MTAPPTPATLEATTEARPGSTAPTAVPWPPRLAESWRRAPARWVLAGSLVAMAVRLPGIGAPVSADEGGFLMVASQWHAGGGSLYGDYWVDRPPLLIGFFAVADQLGGTVPLRLMGCVLAGATVVLAHRLGRAVRALSAPSPWPAVAALAFVSMPIMGSEGVNGELVALPVVLGGLVMAVRASAERGAARSAALWAGAGALGAGAALVKQNFLDVLVFAFALLLLTAWTRRRRPQRHGPAEPRLLVPLSALLAGALLSTTATLTFAATRGTGPIRLWDALVVFRWEAGGVIARSASSATDVRLAHLLLFMLLSGAVAVIGLLASHAVRSPRRPILLATMALSGWELTGVLLGGSYWDHYLLGLIPGLVLAVALLAQAPAGTGRSVRAAVIYAVVIAVVTIPGNALLRGTAADPPAAAWLRAQARPGQTATVLYGSPNILYAAGLSSPYLQLWSLPVRVRDPRLDQLVRVLSGDRPPTWVLARNGLATWGISSARARDLVESRYEHVATVDGYAVYRRLARPAGTATADASAKAPR